MASVHYAANICTQCKYPNPNGIIRSSKFYCSEKCFTQSRRPSCQIKTCLKNCNYCFESHDIYINPGVNYGKLWFCCQHHLNLANPRPKVIVEPLIGLPIGHHIVPNPYIVGHPFIGPFIGPF